MTELKAKSDFTSPPATPADPFAAIGGAGTIEVELRKFYAQLTTGDDALAKRKDLTELHKRIVAMFTTLNQGLVDSQAAKALEDRTQLIERLDHVERAVNSMEGALRIELEPLVTNIVTSVVSKTGDKSHASRMPSSLIVLGICLAIGFGAYFDRYISVFAPQIFPVAQSAILKNPTEPSLIGGSALPENQLK